MREIVLDTETTGLSPKSGDRIVEIGCIEIVNQVATGETYHQYINPKRDMPEEAFSIHGLSAEFLSDKPVFADIVDAFLEFVGSARFVIHNAEFDMNFLNWELKTLGREPFAIDRAMDTVGLAREKFPGAPASLDALCKRFQIDNSNRQLHGALLDARLLADVYLELIGGRQRDLSLPDQHTTEEIEADASKAGRPARFYSASPDELSAHEAFVKKISNAVWSQ